MSTVSAPPPTATPPTPTTPAVPALADIIWQRFVQALNIEQRAHVLRAFSDELDRVSRGKTFRIRNDIVWYAVLDVRDKLVIDLYSLTVEMRHGMKPLGPNMRRPSGDFMAKRGLFIELRDHYYANLTRAYAPRNDDHEVSFFMTRRAENFDRLFPGCAANTPSPADIEQLCERFRIQMVPLGRDRNQNRAHVFEQNQVGRAKMLSVPELEAIFEYVEQLLEDLSLVSSGASFSRHNMANANTCETAADLIDLILLGNISDVRRLTDTRTRDELYTQLHQLDDTAGPPTADETPLHFNDRLWVAPFVDPRAANQV